MFDPQKFVNLVLSDLLREVQSHVLEEKMYLVPPENDPESTQVQAVHRMVSNNLVQGATLDDADGRLNVLLSDDYRLTDEGERYLNPLNLHGTDLQQLHQLFDAFEDKTIDKITRVSYTEQSIPAAINTIIKENLISGFSIITGRSTFYIAVDENPRITVKGYDFIQSQKAGNKVMTVNNINGNQNQVTQGDNNIQKSTNTMLFEQQAQQDLKKFNTAIKNLSEEDQKIAKEIKNDVQNGAVFPNKWEKFKSFFENNPQITGLIGKLIVSATTIGTSFIQ